jgi:hypothetical protein
MHEALVGGWSKENGCRKQSTKELLAQVCRSRKSQNPWPQKDPLVAIFICADGVFLAGAAGDILVNRPRQPLSRFGLEFVQGKEPLHIRSSFWRYPVINAFVFDDVSPFRVRARTSGSEADIKSARVSTSHFTRPIRPFAQVIQHLSRLLDQ